MPPRANPTITMMVAQAQQKLTELKELQFFGGDSLNLSRFSQTVSVAADVTMHCWRVVMTPDDPDTTMPFDAVMKPADALSSQIGGTIERVHRTDGAYEFLFITNAIFGGSPQNMKMRIEYSGKATFAVTQIG